MHSRAYTSARKSSSSSASPAAATRIWPKCSRIELKTLVIYLMAGRATPELAAAAVDGGADIVELGFPFSDPLADGPVIRRAGERALKRGMRTRQCIDVLRQTHELVPETPVVPMTYASLLEAYGWERFAADLADAGAT